MMHSEKRKQIGKLCADTPMLNVRDPRGLTIRKVAYHRAPKAQALIERITQHRYDAAQRLISSFDPKLFATSEARPNLVTSYSLSGQIVHTDSVDAGWRAHWYGAAGQLLQTVDARGTSTRTEYDRLLRPVAVHEKMQHDEERCVERFAYGAHGDRADNQQGCLIRHDDPAGTLEIKSYSLTGAVQHEIRRLLPNKAVPNWLEKEAERNTQLEAQSYATHWAYNAVGELLSQKDAKDNEQRFTYTLAGRLQTAYVKLHGLEEQIVAKGLIYNALGQVLHEEAGNGVITDYTYDLKTQRLSSVRTLRPAKHNQPDRSSQLQHLHYHYDPVGNILRIEDKAPPSQFFNNQQINAASTYTYDTLYQLVKATGREHAGAAQGSTAPSALKITSHPVGTYVNYTRTYAYDAGGNMIVIRGETGASPFTQNMTIGKGSNRLVLVSNLQVDKECFSKLDYDANGNPTALSSGQTLAWDTRNQLCRVTSIARSNTPDDEENYQYDGSGHRIRKTTRALVKHETDAMRCAEIIYLPGLEIRRGYGVNGKLSEEQHVICIDAASRAQLRIQHWEQSKRQEADQPQNQFRYSLSNHLGSSALELDQAADILSYEEYYPFGGTAIWTAKNDVEAKYKVVRYSGKERDATGLYYYGFRYYAPWLARWLNPDPAGTADGLNLFRMVRNNPITLSDPDGLAPNANSVEGETGNKEIIIPKYQRKGAKIPLAVAIWMRNKRVESFSEKTKTYKANNDFKVVETNDIGSARTARQSSLLSNDNIDTQFQIFSYIAKNLIHNFRSDLSEKQKHNLSLLVNVSRQAWDAEHLNHFAVINKNDKSSPTVYGIGSMSINEKNKTAVFYSLIAHPFTQIPSELSSSEKFKPFKKLLIQGLNTKISGESTAIEKAINADFRVKKVGTFLPNKMLAITVGRYGLKKIETEAINPRSAAIAERYGFRSVNR